VRAGAGVPGTPVLRDRVVEAAAVGKKRVFPELELMVRKYRRLPWAGCSAAWMATFPGLSIGPGGRFACR
jgi:hypothetical protein